MLHFIDHTSVGDHHMVFNAAIISILLKMYPDQKLMAHGISSNQKSIRELLHADELKKVVFNEIIYTESKNDSFLYKAINYLRKETKRKEHLNTLLKDCRKDDFLFLSTTTFMCFYYFKKQKKAYSVPTLAALHGDVIFLDNPKDWIGQLNLFINKKIFKLKIPDFKYLVLNKIAKPNLVESGFFENEEILEIHHPFLFLNTPTPKQDSCPARSPIMIGHIGSMEIKRKGSQHLYALAATLQEEVTQQKITFKVIGLQTPELIPYKNQWVEELVGNEELDKPRYLSRNQYESELKKLDYCIFFYPTHQYVFRASGAVVDFISHLIPIIALKHPFFDYLFQIAGNIGFICSDLVEMELLLKKIANGDREILNQYHQQQRNIQLLQEEFSVDAIAKDLKEQMSSFFN